MLLLVQRFWRFLITHWWRFLGFFRDENADYVEISVAFLEFQVASLFDPATRERSRVQALETLNRLGRYHGWI